MITLRVMLARACPPWACWQHCPWCWNNNTHTTSSLPAWTPTAISRVRTECGWTCRIFGNKCLADHGWQSCFGTTPDTAKVTTCTARTFLQPQMNKVNLAAERTTNGDVNPKDHILFLNPDVHTRGCRLVCEAGRDNTGSGDFKSDVTFPTLMFPSDHAIICAVLELEPKQSN